MSNRIRVHVAVSAMVAIGTLAGCVAAPPPPPSPPPRVVIAPPQHPAYLHALSDLRAARWLIEHRPGDWAQTADEQQSIQQIDAAITEIKRAAFDDGKNGNARPPVDEHPDNRGRIHEAVQFLIKARADIAREEDNGFANGLRDRALGHIDGAIHAARQVFKD
jgi:hypothetical protein